MIGRTLSHYRIVEKLGAGGMGEVYRARDEKLGRDVAVKVLPEGLLADDAARSRFRKEADALSRLSHPHVATLLDVDTAEGLDFLVMELVTGPSPAEQLYHGPLPEKEVVRLGTQIARGLQAAHEQGVVHRDLKPQNIMICSDGTIRVLDFGIAKATGRRFTFVGFTPAMGTPEYMAPEQVRGKRGDERTDIYSLGAMLYEMITGRRAFRRDSHISTLAAVLHEEPEPVSRISGGVPKELERIITRCLKKDPERRFQHMDDVKVALEELRESPAKRRKLEASYWIAAAVAVMSTGIWMYLRFFPREAALPPIFSTSAWISS